MGKDTLSDKQFSILAELESRPGKTAPAVWYRPTDLRRLTELGYVEPPTDGRVVRRTAKPIEHEAYTYMCRNCGKQFNPKDSDIEHLVGFCSDKCQAEYYGFELNAS